MGIPISSEQLVEVAELSCIDAAQVEFIEDEPKQALKAKISNPEEIESKDANKVKQRQRPCKSKLWFATTRLIDLGST